MASGKMPKRERAASAEELASLDHAAQRTRPSMDMCHGAPDEPLLAPLAGETKASYFRRLKAALPGGRFSPAHAFARDGIYVAKRPVRSASPQHSALLAQAGSVFHHAVVYVKQGERLEALEFGPAGGMDVTANFLLAEAIAGPTRRAAPPPPDCLPMLHIAADHHPLDSEHVGRALDFAESRPYHALARNCIAFADFAVRVLTGGRVRGAPLVFDLLCGTVPDADSPLLPLLHAMTRLTWFDVCDGGRLMRGFLEAHGPAAVVPVGELPAPAQAAGAGEEDAGPAAAAVNAQAATSTESAQSADTGAGAGGAALRSSGSSGVLAGGVGLLPARRRAAPSTKPGGPAGGRG